jgi:hypothetical protein
VGALPLLEVLDVVLRQRRKLKYKFISDSVHELIEERMAEGVLCQSAFNTIRDDNEVLSSELF